MAFKRNHEEADDDYIPPGSQPKRVRTKASRQQVELAAELASLAESSLSDRLRVQDALQYAPKVPGTQNAAWSELPGEIRNKIYEHAMANEEQKTLNVVHYPGGIPRRSVRGMASKTNFAHSYWGFTQTCRQVRDEFTPWLLNKRRVRTPLATLNDYIDMFHRPDETGKRVGWIEPVCRDAPLPGDGVEILGLLQHQNGKPNFHLQLTPTVVRMELDPNEFDELTLIRDMDETFWDWSGNILEFAGIHGIHITSIVKGDKVNGDSDEDSVEEDEGSHQILVKLDVERPRANNNTHQRQLHNLNRFIFASQIAHKEGVRVQASFNGGIARWVVRRPGTVDMQWKEHKHRGVNMFRRLTSLRHLSNAYREEDL